MKIELSKKYLGLYNIEDYLFNSVGPRIKQREHIEFDEFYMICMWKSARQKNRYLKNKNIIRKISKISLAKSDELSKLQHLLKLDGVGIPMASAILSVVFPEKYPVIDKRCIQMLKKLGKQIGESITEKRWIEYLTVVRDLAVVNSLTPRQVDQILFAMHRESNENNGFKNLYD